MICESLTSAARRQPALSSPICCLISALTIGIVSASMSAKGMCAEVDQSTGGGSSRIQKAETLLVLQSGRIIGGRISQSAGGYLVEKPNGRMLIPFRLVRFEAANMKHAYEKMQQIYPEKTDRARLAIARWCLSHRLYDEAGQELRAALELSPQNQEARQMLDRLQMLISRNDLITSQQPTSPQSTRDGFSQQQAESLHGLSTRSTREFTSRIQPILINKCGNVRCHARAGRNNFHLIHVRSARGSRRRAVDQNLAEILKYVNKTNPGESKLLTISRGSHGRGGRDLFGSRQDEKLLDALEKWVYKIAEETSNENPFKRDARLFAGATKPRQQVEPFIRGGKELSTTFSASDKRRGEPKRLEGESPADIPVETSADPFDPAVFNREVFGKR